MPLSPDRFTFDVAGSGSVDAALLVPEQPASALFVFAHGAGAGMRHPFMVQLSVALAQRGIATLRFQFPYMQAQSKRPDPPAVAQATIRAAVTQAAQRLPGVPLFAGGKSYGGRMTSAAQAIEPLPGVKGIVFVGFPLHSPKEPAKDRATHLAQVQVPMLFLQGTRDELAQLPLITEVTQELGARATLHVVEGGDHSFEVLVRSGRTEEEVRAELADTIAQWLATLSA
jgi:predicted alpha/beta-hydrolase family hydrolase